MSSCVYGPVPSRRLGKSLGVDLVPYKYCTYDCIYCQLGRTTNKTIERHSWVPVSTLLDQIENHLKTQPDWITLSGSGEPTLYSRIGDLIDKIKDRTDTPVAVLTNGSLFGSHELRKELYQADLVAPSLDAGNPELQRCINRPHEDIPFDIVVSGLIDFRNEYQGQYWLEVFLLGSITGMLIPIEEMARIAERINPDRIQLNTVVRPPAESFAMPVAKDLLECYAAAFGDKAEVIADLPGKELHHFTNIDPEEVLDLVSRRPCTLDDISTFLGVHRAEAMKYMEQLAGTGQVRCEYQSRRLFYKSGTSLMSRMDNQLGQQSSCQLRKNTMLI